MSLRKNDGPGKPPLETEPDDLIIDLVEEIGDQESPEVLSDLEQNLLDISNQVESSRPGSSDLPDLADLGSLEFEEEDDETPADSESLQAAAGEATSLLASEDMDWLPQIDTDFLSAPTPKPPAVTAKGVTEVSDFDEQFLDAEDLLDDSPPAPGREADSGDDSETLELLDVEDDETDNEILWFDDLDKETAPADLNREPPPRADMGADGIARAAAADFLTPVDSEPPTSPAAGAGAFPEPSVLAAAAALASPPQAPPALTPPASEIAPPEAAGLSPEEIEAVVERVITRKLGGSIEAIILQAIEKAVTQEIERLKNLLLADDAGERPR